MTPLNMRMDPIVISPYDERWPGAFELERERLERVLRGGLALGIEHIGSTAIPGMAAKPIIDMLAVVLDIDDVRHAVGPLGDLGWVSAPEPGNEKHRVRSFCTPSIANRTHHLHLVEEASQGWRGTIAFRDYLRGHPGLAAAYAALKRELALAHGADANKRDAYRDGKSRFIAEVTRVALEADEPQLGPMRTAL
ncbi:MAG: GrpB family protein [Acidimicrobiales bacterium]